MTGIEKACEKLEDDLPCMSWSGRKRKKAMRHVWMLPNHIGDFSVMRLAPLL